MTNEEKAMAAKAANLNLLDSIRPGDRVTILVHSGGTCWRGRTGKALMRGTHGWMLDMGGRYGTPGVATVENLVSVRRKA
jgi:hypothetical protein